MNFKYPECNAVIDVTKPPYNADNTGKTEEGQRMGYRLRGQEQIVRGIEDIKRAAKLGVRGFLIYDEGLLYVLNEARKIGYIPSDCHFKVSAHSTASFTISALSPKCSFNHKL